MASSQPVTPQPSTSTNLVPLIQPLKRKSSLNNQHPPKRTFRSSRKLQYPAEEVSQTSVPNLQKKFTFTRKIYKFLLPFHFMYLQIKVTSLIGMIED